MIEETCRENLLAIAKAYAKAKRIRLSQVSRRHYGTSNFLADFGEGKVTISLKKYDEIIADIMADWPENAKWPLLYPVRINRPERKQISGKLGKSVSEESRIA